MPIVIILFWLDPVENQTFFTKSKILEKAVNQVQDDDL
jgi:hypothetical protein